MKANLIDAKEGNALHPTSSGYENVSVGPRDEEDGMHRTSLASRRSFSRSAAAQGRKTTGATSRPPQPDPLIRRRVQLGKQTAWRVQVVVLQA